MGRWSGLAPAVNGHLARWAAIDREWESLERLAKADRDGKVTTSVAKMPFTAQWGYFARTWGVPDGDGVIHTPVVVDGQTINGREQFTTDDLAASMGAQLMAREVHMLGHAVTHYVSGPIVDQVTEAALEMVPEPLYDTDIITPDGIFVFEKPIQVPDLHPESGVTTDYLHVAVRAIGWCHEDRIGQINEDYASGQPGVMLFIYTTRDDWMESYGLDLRQAIRTGRVSVEDAFPDLRGAYERRDRNTVLGRQRIEVLESLKDPKVLELVLNKIQPPGHSEGMPRDMLWISDVCPWRFKTPWFVGEIGEPVVGKMDATVGYVRRWFLTIMRFCWQRILYPTREPFTKKAQARLHPFESKKPVRDYTVLRLRRYRDQPRNETGMGQPLGYRQLVRWHWKQVYYPSLGPARLPDGSFNPDSHRQTRIEPYWRGPEGADIGPLHSTTSVVR